MGATAWPIVKAKPMSWDQKRIGRRPIFLIKKIAANPPHPSKKIDQLGGKLEVSAKH